VVQVSNLTSGFADLSGPEPAVAAVPWIILRSVSETTLVSRKSKLRSGIDLPVFANDGLQIEIAAEVVR
jgi:hypothetical protein